MTATLSMIPLARIHASADNPRSDFDDERMAELIESVKRHGIITPLTLSPDGDGGFTIAAWRPRRQRHPQKFAMTHSPECESVASAKITIGPNHGFRVVVRRAPRARPRTRTELASRCAAATGFRRPIWPG